MKIKLFGKVVVYINWSMAVGFFLYYLSILGAMAYVLLLMVQQAVLANLLVFHRLSLFLVLV